MKGTANAALHPLAASQPHWDSASRHAPLQIAHSRAAASSLPTSARAAVPLGEHWMRCFWASAKIACNCAELSLLTAILGAGRPSVKIRVDGGEPTNGSISRPLIVP